MEFLLAIRCLDKEKTLSMLAPLRIPMLVAVVLWLTIAGVAHLHAAGQATTVPGSRPKAAATTNPATAPQRAPPPLPTVPKKLPAPQNVSLRASFDGVGLSATFYPTPLEKDSAKEAVPVILLHQFKGSRADYADLAIALQSAGCAVLVPDLRGHGLSTRRALPDGKDRTLEPQMLGRQDFDLMAYAGRDGGGDVEMCKSFLLEKNNSKQLNIDKLCVVGAEMGAVVAIDWSANDWSWPALPGRKQGQDVKAVVLLSPPWSFKGLTINLAVGNRDFVSQVSWLILVGEQDSKGFNDAKRLRQALEKFLPPALTAAGGPRVDFHQYPTSLEGAKLLGIREVTSEILKFIDQQVTKSSHPWTDRTGPL